MKRLAIPAICALTLLVPSITNAATYRWTPAKAQNRVKAVYRTPDTAAHNAPDAVVASARCAGLGRPVNHRYSRFQCTVTMQGWGEYIGDGFHAVQKITVAVTGALSFTLTGPGKVCPVKVAHCP